MKKLVAILFVFVLAAVVISFAADNASTMKGYIVDQKCATAHKGQGPFNAACAQKCVGAGEKAVFVNDKDHSIMVVDNQDAVKDHVGEHVQVKGSANNDTLHVDSVKTLAEKGKASTKAGSSSM
jgi:hypothetical protein